MVDTGGFHVHVDTFVPGIPGLFILHSLFHLMKVRYSGEPQRHDHG